LAPARKKRFTIFLATSPIHRTAKLNMSCEQVLRAAHEFSCLRGVPGDDVEFSAEDAIRTEMGLEVLQAVADAGAKTLNVPDTVGYSTPAEIGDLFRLIEQPRAAQPHVRLSAHCHNDLGMAVANSLAAVQAGARQVECTINGIGGARGNCALEEVVMALRTRSDLFGISTGIDTTQLSAVSRLVCASPAHRSCATRPAVGKKCVRTRGRYSPARVMQERAHPTK